MLERVAADLDELARARRVADLEGAAVLPDPWRAEAQRMALISIAYELGELRGNLLNVKDALEDQDGFGVGTHARNASDWLEKISDRLGNM
ncbi:hypothetical protein [Actinoplanes sp. NPDC020271]|uniref:hypothetical protein n=1 Tax=Actinoplanes sp. NPDC020271 TaxID=3363896 RepID=UPI0037AC566E